MHFLVEVVSSKFMTFVYESYIKLIIGNLITFVRMVTCLHFQLWNSLENYKLIGDNFQYVVKVVSF